MIQLGRSWTSSEYAIFLKSSVRSEIFVEPNSTKPQAPYGAAYSAPPELKNVLTEVLQICRLYEARRLAFAPSRLCALTALR
jgi:hypothetical protein